MTEIIVLGAGIGGIQWRTSFARSSAARRISHFCRIRRVHFVPPIHGWRSIGGSRKTSRSTSPRSAKTENWLRRHRGEACAARRERDRTQRRPPPYLRYLVIATGPALAFDEIDGLVRSETPFRLPCRSRKRDRRKWEHFCKNPGPIVIGAVQGASCFGPAYEFALIVNADLRKRKIRDRVPITFVTSSLYRPSRPWRRWRHQGRSRIGVP